MLDVRDIIHKNYEEYKVLMANGTCTGGAVDETEARTIAHVYGWQPWVEAKSGVAGEGCSPTANLLENTPGYGAKAKTYELYAKVKTEFDNLNYGGPSGTGWNPGPLYNFNPWVTFIHGTPPGMQDPAKGNLGMPGVYAYSVDDAVGNLNVYATGYIVTSEARSIWRISSRLGRRLIFRSDMRLQTRSSLSRQARVARTRTDP
jgi:hypothetical protein